ncbi:MAG TPA: hypothetical protein VK892_06465, partial [Pyrinomonadaceae bacterium]|nr:hypothetical protein [Pyrinomonadaceae bacterium]
LIFMTILSVAVLVFAGCGDTTNTTNATNTANTAVVKNTTENKAATNTSAANNAPTMSEEEMEKMMTEDISGIDTAKPISVDELFEKFTAGESEWKNKKVAVNGKFAMYGTSSSVINPKKSAFLFELKGEKGGVVCKLKERPKEVDEIQNRKDFTKDVYLTIKGVTRWKVEGAYSKEAVALEPCEIVKMEVK